MGGKSAAGGGFNPNNIGGNAGAGLHNFAPGDGFGGFGGKSAASNAPGSAARTQNLSNAVAKTGAQAPPLPAPRPNRAPIAPTRPPIPPVPGPDSRLYLNPLPNTPSVPTATPTVAATDIDPNSGLQFDPRTGRPINLRTVGI
jgi:hypothetical protein